MKTHLRRFWIGLLALAPLLVLLNLALFALRAAAWDPNAAIAEAGKYEVEIIRDQYGVPHIYGKRDVDVAFGLSYAHAEDDFKTMQQMIPFYRGQLAREIGLDGAPIDFLVHWLDVRRQVGENYERVLSPQIRAHLKAYSDGLNYYAATHPMEADPRLFPITPQDLTVGFSLQHLLFYGFESHVTKLFADSPQYELAVAPDSAALTRRIGAAGLPVGSNAFAINGNKSSDGATRIIINSHQPLTGPVAWYEARVKSGEGWDMHGGVFPVCPLSPKALIRILAMA